MDINPFDQFGSELGSALPSTQNHNGNAAPEPTPNGNFDLGPKQDGPRKPVMNSGNMGGPPPPGGFQGGGGPGGYGAPPFQQQQPPAWGQQQMGGGPGGMYGNALVPSQTQSNPYALGPGMGGPPPMQPQQQQAPNSMGMGMGMMGPGGPPPQQQQAPNSWGAPAPTGPPPQQQRPPQQRQQQQAPPQQGGGFDDIFGGGGGGGGGSVHSGGPPSMAPPPPPESPARSMMGSVNGGPPPPYQSDGGFDDIFGGGGGGPPSVQAPPPPPPGPTPGPPPNQQPQQQFGGQGPYDQQNGQMDGMFGMPAAPAPGPPPGPPPPNHQQQQQMVSAPPSDAFGGVFDSPSRAPPADPWGPSAGPPAAAASSALVTSNAVDDDPFGIFGSGGPPAPPAPVEEPEQAPSSQHSRQQQGGGGGPGGAGSAATSTSTEMVRSSAPRGEGGLPPGGEFYDAKIFTPTLGVMFFKPQELTDSLFLQTDRDLVGALDDRPVVAFIVEGSSARSAGVELGHVLLKVNGIDVRNPKEASRLIKEGPRPLPLLFYVPDTTVVVAEGEHMVKYDTRETGAPPSSKDWKPKYVVVGGIIAQSWMLNMYRSKSEYDIAVIETQARRPVSVKVKQFSLQSARIQNDFQGPQMVKYKHKLHPWKYFVVLPISRNPIKISSPNLTQLKPVHEGIRRVLAAQQQNRGPGQHTAGPVPVPRNMPPPGGNQYGGPPSPGRPQYQQQQPPPQYHHAPPPQHQQQQQQQGPPPSYSQYPAAGQPSPSRDPYGPPPQQQQQQQAQGGYRAGGESGARQTSHPEYQY